MTAASLGIFFFFMPRINKVNPPNAARISKIELVTRRGDQFGIKINTYTKTRIIPTTAKIPCRFLAALFTGLSCNIAVNKIKPHTAAAMNKAIASSNTKPPVLVNDLYNIIACEN